MEDVFQAYVDLVRAWGWKSFTIVYENSDGLVRLQELLKAHGPSELPVAVRQLPDSYDYRLVKVTTLYFNNSLKKILRNDETNTT